MLSRCNASGTILREYMALDSFVGALFGGVIAASAACGKNLFEVVSKARVG